jgi:hypothetical protein
MGFWNSVWEGVKKFAGTVATIAKRLYRNSLLTEIELTANRKSING